jgi:restriction endonuclease S subunit
MNSLKLTELVPLLRNDSDFLEIELLVRNRLLSGANGRNTETNIYESLAQPNWLKLYEDSKAASRWKPSRKISLQETYPLPHGWRWVRLNDLAIYINGLAFKPADWNPTGTPIIRIQNLSNDLVSFNHTDKQFNSDYLVTKGDILVSWSATLDAFVWKKQDAWLNQHIFRILPNLENVTVDYLYLLLKEAIKNLSESSHKHGLTMKHINRGPFLDHLVPLPPLQDQSQICLEFEKLKNEIANLHKVRTATTKRAFKVTKAVLSNLLESLNAQDSVLAEKKFAEFFSHISEQVIESASTSYLTTGLLRQIQKLVVAALPKSSDDWKHGTVGDFLVFNYGKAMPKSARKIDGKIPVYGSNGVVGFHNEALIDKRCVIVGRKGSTGALQIVNEQSWVTDVAYYVFESSDVSFEFLPLLLGTLDMEKMARGVKPGLNRNEVYSLPISIPPIYLQEKTMMIVASIEKLLCELSIQVEMSDKVRTKAINSILNELRLSSPSAA